MCEEHKAVVLFPVFHNETAGEDCKIYRSFNAVAVACADKLVPLCPGSDQEVMYSWHHEMTRVSYLRDTHVQALMSAPVMILIPALCLIAL